MEKRACQNASDSTAGSATPVTPSTPATEPGECVAAHITHFPAAPRGPPPLPRSLLPALLQLWHAEGANGLFAGLRPACLSLAVSNSVYYSLYAAFRNASLRRSRSTQLSGLAALPVSFAAGCLSVLLTNPFWVVVTRLQARTERLSSGVLRELQLLLKEGGAAALWRGTLPSLALVANPVVQFAAFEGIMSRLRRRTAASVFLAGAVAKLLATFATYPFLLQKSRRQAACGGGAQPQPAMLRELLDVARREGLGGLYAGVGSKAVQTALATAILFTTKEQLMRGVAAALRGRRGRAADSSVVVRCS